MSASPSVWLGSPAGLLVVTLVRGDIGGRGDARWVFAVRGAASLPGGKWTLRPCFFPCSSLPWDIFFYHLIQEARRGLPAVRRRLGQNLVWVHHLQRQNALELLHSLLNLGSRNELSLLAGVFVCPSLALTSHQHTQLCL